MVLLKLHFLICAEDASRKDVTTENCCQDSNAAASRVPLLVPTIHIETPESSDQSYEPEKLHRVNRLPVRTPRVAGSNTLVIQQDDSITYGSPSPQPVTRRHAAVERTLSVDSGCTTRQHLSIAYSPAHSVLSSRASSADMRSRASSFSGRSQASSVGKRSNDCNYVDDFDESSDIDEGLWNFSLQILQWKPLMCISRTCHVYCSAAV